MDDSIPLIELVTQAKRLFGDRYRSEPQWIVAAPGRVNLIGEHTDYNDGFVLPMAIERYVVFAAGRPLDDPERTADDLRVYSRQVGEEQTIHVGGDFKSLPGWCVYIQGVLDLMRTQGFKTGPVDAVVLSSVPLGGGLSSSAALEVSTATLVEAITSRFLDGREKAKLCQRAENEYVGMPCGIMDQFSSALCREGEAMRLDCRSLETTPVPLDDPKVTILLINSNVSHELSSSEYPVRRAQCQAAAQALGVDSLRDATPELLAERAASLDPVALMRARHVIGEIQRVLEFSDAAAARNWVRAGELMYASHESLRDDYEVSCPEVDKLVEFARGIGREGGVFGSRITGGGFGGCTVTLCETDKARAIAKRIVAEYRDATGIDAAAFTSRPARGAHIIES